jgi:RNA polymerase sigma-70 factor (ECF subfamily)
MDISLETATTNPMWEEEENRLVALAQAGDHRAFERIVGQNYDFLFRAAWRWTGNREDAEDIAQEVCIRLVRAIRQFEAKSSLRTFLYAITLNAVRDHGRKAAREARTAQAFHTHALTQDRVAGSQGHRGADEDPAIALWQAVRSLPEMQRDAVLLVHGEGTSHAQAAVLLGCSEKTVSWHIHEARKRLKELTRAGDDNNE